MIEEGAKAPDFEGINQDGEKIKLKDFKGEKIVLYFYPKDNTAGCNAEACNLRDNYNEFLNLGYEIIGISPDDEKKHQKFIEKFDLPFNLIADTEKEILQKYGVWGEKKMYGRTYMGVIRTTFIINEKGIIEKVIKKVKTKEHSKQIFKELDLK
jgi:peroxiredoxin Q/BCP